MKNNVVSRSHILLTLFSLTVVLSGAHAGVSQAAWLQSSRLADGTTNLDFLDPRPLLWSPDQEGVDPAFFEHSPEDLTQIAIRQDGDYLVAATLPIVSTIDTDTTRASQAIEVYVNGEPAAGAIGQSTYIRHNTGHNESSAHVHTLLQGLSAGDIVQVMTYRTNNTTQPTSMDVGSVYLEFVAAERPVFAGLATTTMEGDNVNSDTAPALIWAESRKDAGYAHEPDSDAVTLDEAGTYVVFVNVPLEGAVTRASVIIETWLDGFPVLGAIGQQGYIRNTNAHTQSSVHWAGIVTSETAGQVLTFHTRAGAAAGDVTVQPEKAASVFIERIDTGAGVFASGAFFLLEGSNWNSNWAIPIFWDTDAPFNDTSVYTHDALLTGHQIQVNEDGSFLLIYSDVVADSGPDRRNPGITVAVNGTRIPGATVTSHYIRDNNGADESSGTLVFLLQDLTAGDVLTLSTEAESNIGTVSAQDEARITLIKKKTLVPDPARPAVTLTGDAIVRHQQGTAFSDPGATAVDGSGNDISGQITVTGSVDTDTPGSYFLGYGVTADALDAVPAIREVIVGDATPPEITLIGQDTVEFLVNGVYEEFGAVATDNSGESILVAANGELPRNGLVAYYKFDEDSGATEAVDSSGMENTGSVFGTADFVDDPERGRVLVLDGADSYIDLGVLPQLFRTPEFTISLWFNQEVANDSDVTNHNISNVIVGHSSNATNDDFELGLEGSNIEIYLDTSGRDGLNGRPAVAAGIEPGAWHHVMVVYDQDEFAEFKIYLDGILIHEYRDAGGVLDTDPNTPWTIGLARPDMELWGDFTGRVDEVAFWNRALTDFELTTAVSSTANHVDVATIGDYPVVYSASDSAGNESQTTRTVRILDKLTVPQLRLTGPEEVVVEINSPYEDPGATGIDPDGNAIDPAEIVVDNPVDVSVIGVYTILYTFSDPERGTANPIRRTVTVVDTTPPVVTLLGNSRIVLPPGTPFVDPGATATDNSGQVSGPFSSASSLPSAGLVGHWRFDDFDGSTVAVDSSPLGYDGVISGAVLTSDPVRGRVVQFDGDDDYVDVGIISELIDTPNFSFSVWFNREEDLFGGAIDTNHAKNNVLIAHSSGPFNDDFELGTERDSYEYYLDTGTVPDTNINFSPPGIRPNAGIQNDLWHHVVVTYDMNDPLELKIYLDGALVLERGDFFSGPFDGDPATPWTVGISRPDQTVPAAVTGDKWGEFQGQIDDVAIWGRPLTAEDVTELHAQTDPEQALLEGVVGFWRFNEDAGATETADSSGNDHTATIIGAATFIDDPDRGRVLDLDGNDSGVYLGAFEELVSSNPDGTVNSTGELTVSVWFKRTADLAGTGLETNHAVNNILVAHSSTDTNDDFELGTGAEFIEMYLDTEGQDGPNADSTGFSTGSVQDGVWHHVVATYGVIDPNGDPDAPEFRIYHNGVLLHEQNSPDGPLDGNANTNWSLGIARTDADLWGEFKGLMDDAALWNVTLTEQQVMDIFSGTPDPTLSQPGEHVVTYRAVDPSGNETIATRTIIVPSLIISDIAAGASVTLTISTLNPQWEHKVQEKTALTDANFSDVPDVTFTEVDGQLIAEFAAPDADIRFYQVVALPPPPIFSDDFEGDELGWSHSGTGDTWERGTPTTGPGAAHSGDNVWGTDLDAPYAISTLQILRSPVIDLTGVDAATLEFWEFRNVEPLFGVDIVDFTEVNIKDGSDPEILIANLAQDVGEQTEWTKRSFSLQDFLGQTIVIEFLMVSDAFEDEPRDGWYIDDVVVIPE